MHKYLIYAAYGWLAFSGTAHFLIDVVSQYFRGKRTPGNEATLYYGLNTAYSLGQVAFGLVGLWLAWRAMALLKEPALVALSIAAAAGWLVITFLFMEYREPKVAAGIFLLLVVAASLAR
jgi:hypothetical protein